MLTQLAEILPHLFVGSSKDAWNTELLKQLGVTHILNVMESARAVSDSDFKRYHVPLSDYGDGDLARAALRCCEIIEEAKLAGEKVLLHCARGQNRSPSIATAYLLRCCGMTLREAFDHVRARRPQYAPHEEYLHQLREMERALLGRVTLDESLEPLSIHSIVAAIRSTGSEPHS